MISAMPRKHLHQEKLYTENVHDLAHLSLWNAQETLIHGKAWYWTYVTKKVTERSWIKKVTANAKLGHIILNGENSLEQTVAVTVYNPKSSGSKNDLSNAEEVRYFDYITKRVYIRATDLDCKSATRWEKRIQEAGRRHLESTGVDRCLIWTQATQKTL